MAYRININSELWSDPRFIELCIKTGSQEFALGAVVKAWVMAQKHATTDSNLIPLEDWESAKMTDKLFDVGLALKLEEGVYVKGSEKHLAWLSQRRKAGQLGGKASAAAREAAKGTAQPGPKQTEAQPKHARSNRSVENLGTKSEQPSEDVGRSRTDASAVLRETRSINQAGESKPNPTIITTVTTQKEISHSHTQAYAERGKPNQIDPVQVRELIAVWQETLDQFQIPKQAGLEGLSIAKLLTAVGFQAAKAALIGQRFERPYDNFKPDEEASVARILRAVHDQQRRPLFDKLVSLGLKKTATKRQNGNAQAIEASLQAWEKESKT